MSMPLSVSATLKTNQPNKLQISKLAFQDHSYDIKEFQTFNGKLY